MDRDFHARTFRHGTFMRETFMLQDFYTLGLIGAKGKKFFWKFNLKIFFKQFFLNVFVSNNSLKQSFFNFFFSKT